MGYTRKSYRRFANPVSGSGGGDTPAAPSITPITILGDVTTVGNVTTLAPGAVADLGEYTTPQSIQAVISWDTPPASTSDVVTFLFNANADAAGNWDGWGIHLSKSSVGGVAAHKTNDAVNNANPSPTSPTGSVSAGSTAGAGDKVSGFGRLSIGDDAVERMALAVDVVDADSSASYGNLSNAETEVDLRSTAAAYTARLLVANNSGEDVKIYLDELVILEYRPAGDEEEGGDPIATQTLHVFGALNLAEQAIANGDLVNGVFKIAGHANVYQVSGGAWVPNQPLTQTIFDTAHLGVWSVECPYGFKGIDGATASVDADGRLVIDNAGTARSFSLVQWVGSTFGRVAMVEAVVTRTAGAFSAASTSFWVGISEANEAGYGFNPKGYFAWLTDSVVGSLYQDTTAGGFVGIANSQAHGQDGPTYNVALLAVPRAIDDGDTTSEGVFFAGVGGGAKGAMLSSIADHAAEGWDPDEVGFVAADYTLSLALKGSANTVTVGAVAVGTPALYQY